MDDETKLTLHGLQQFYIKLTAEEKNRKLNELLDALEFNQVVIFVSKVRALGRAMDGGNRANERIESIIVKVTRRSRSSTHPHRPRNRWSAPTRSTSCWWTATSPPSASTRA